MSAREDDVFLENMISLTANKEWGELTDELKKEIYQNQANILENAKGWDAVVFAKGWCAALAYIISLRERSIMFKEQAQVEAETALADAAVPNADV